MSCRDDGEQSALEDEEEEEEEDLPAIMAMKSIKAAPEVGLAAALLFCP